MLGHHRVPTPHRMSLPVGAVAGITVDVVAMDWIRVVQRIAKDIAQSTLPRSGSPVVLDARAWLKVEARLFTQEF